MELSVNDQVIKNPSAQDIVRAVDATPYPDDWYIDLVPDEDSYIEAFPADDGTFSLMALADGEQMKASSTIDAERLKTILIKYLHRDASWRGECQWTEHSAETTTRKSFAPPTWAVATVVGSIVLVGLVFSLAGSGLRDALPFGNSDYFYIGLIFLPMVVLILAAVTSKLIEARRAARWPQTSGRIVKSGVEVRRHQFPDSPVTVTNVPAVVYEFTALGRKCRGTRISIGEDSGGANLEATLRRYPVGAVVTVYYDPADPKNCVLERDVPDGMARGCAAMAAIATAVIFGIWYLTTHASRLLESYAPEAQAPAAIFAICFGLALLLFFFASRRTTRIAADWPFVRGKIVSSGTEAVRKMEDGRTNTYYSPAVEYAYRVNGADYRSRQINLGVTVSGSQVAAEKQAARYKPGSEVDVHYDPKNPSNAALENPTSYNWIILAAAAFCFVVAAHAIGLF
ncbi:DUF3592 domain-containing protein [Roseiarcaceae bacterium H3SJ34-1]|uniref:DUF3592 domain-containing protein n=1 Tax=Terripilifer ovatus TaxID=3032367 RepID=UPI003AB91EF8|nr:DUF3592 domain-containing protein [Roseiarcaceae bacterium H3SJ34-1]